MFIVFRASGADFDPQQFAAAHELDQVSFWLRGRPSRPGKVAPETSGLRFPLPEAETSLEAEQVIRKFLSDCGGWLDALNGQGIDCEIDIGLTVGSEAAFTASVTFNPSFLREIANHRIGLVCTAYPWSD